MACLIIVLLNYGLGMHLRTRSHGFNVLQNKNVSQLTLEDAIELLKYPIVLVSIASKKNSFWFLVFPVIFHFSLASFWLL